MERRGFVDRHLSNQSVDSEQRRYGPLGIEAKLITGNSSSKISVELRMSGSIYLERCLDRDNRTSFLPEKATEIRSNLTQFFLVKLVFEFTIYEIQLYRFSILGIKFGKAFRGNISASFPSHKR
ncbi:hypothetical protein ACTXT7_006908 [Hymenolepis weldensis]